MSNQRQLRKAEADALARLAGLRDDPGKALPPAQARAARDAQIVRAQEAKAQLDTVRAELSTTEEKEQSIFARMWSAPENRKNRRPEENERLDKQAAERKAFHDEIRRGYDERNAEVLARRKAAGYVWEAVAPGGGSEVGAVFSSALLWDATQKEIRDGVLVEPSLHARDVVHLWWSLNAIAAGGGSITYPTGNTLPPHWPSYDVEAPMSDAITYRENSITQLAKVGLIAIERGAGTITLTYGPRAKALADTWRKSAA